MCQSGCKEPILYQMSALKEGNTEISLSNCFIILDQLCIHYKELV
jgi:hypothetical protein